MSQTQLKLFGILRILLGWLLLWAFLDKLLGLGHATPAGKSWLDGVSPTAGFLGHATTGPLASTYHALAGSGLIDWLFMLGLLLIGLALILGIGTRIAGITGSILMLLMFSSLIPAKQNLLIDEHILYLVVFLIVAHGGTGDEFGFGKAWRTTALVRRYPILE